ncbi:MAG: hypothetical protein O3A00_13410 [Planctomycetota bacterium]|nr:hypothetical protein [Planctomycetota bacterium]
MKLIDLPHGTHAKLDGYRRHVRAVKLAEGVLAAVFGLVLSYLLVFVLDRIWDTPIALRALMLLVGSLGFGVFFPLKCHRWVWKTRRMEQVARLLKHAFPRLGDQLLGIVELAQSESEQNRSQTLIRAAMAQVDESIRDRDFSDAVPNARHRSWAWAAGIPLALTVLVFAIVPAAGGNALMRWIWPWGDTERFTFAQIEGLPDQLVVPMAEAFDVHARLAAETRWSPQTGTAQYGSQAKLTAKLTENVYQFQLPPQQETGTMVVSVGDVKHSIEIRPTRRPELRDIQATVTLPSYLGYSSDLISDVRGGVISLVKGSTAGFRASATRELQSAELDGEAQTVDGPAVVTAPVAVLASGVKRLTWRDRLGLTSREPFVLTVNAKDDEAPAVFCDSLSQNHILLSTDVLTFDIRAEDDFGLKRVGLEWVGVADPLRNAQPAKGEKLVFGGDHEMKEIVGRATFSPEREGLKPRTIQLRAFVEDFKPDRERSYSATFIVHVLSPAEHAIWLTEQLAKWIRQADGVYEREMQLHDRNLELRKLTAQEIDRAENRQRIEQQAAAERANAARLGALTHIGQQLVEQATRNDQFNVATLETWAEMLQKLKDISGKRMPSVADLLKNSARAPGQVPSSQNSTPTVPSPKVGNIRDSKPGQAGPTKPSEPGKPIPQIIDVESGSNDPKQPNDAKKEPSKSGAGGLTLPKTDVLGGGPDQKGGPEAPCPAQDALEQAVEEQIDLLAEFEKVREELQKILDNLESSTFVKRLKAASRRQIEIANDMNKILGSSFGRTASDLPEVDRKISSKVVIREDAQSENVYTIQEDLEAYFNRKQQGKFKTVLNEMQETQVASKLKEIGTVAVENRKGKSIVMAEFWADHLDRWAEQLVGPG